MLLGKRLELLHELVPKASIIGILVNPDAADAEPEIGEVTAAAQTLGQRIQVLSASGDAAIETAFATLAERGVRGLFVSPNAFFTNRREQIIALAHGMWSLRSMDGANTLSAGVL